jgi:hypothetical protein
VFREFTEAEFENGALHTWAKKKFVESFLAWEALERDQYLLPDGEIKNLLADVAQAKALPASSVDFHTLHKRGLKHAEELRSDPSQQPDLKRAIRALTFPPRLTSIEEQKEILRKKGFL